MPDRTESFLLLLTTVPLSIVFNMALDFCLLETGFLKKIDCHKNGDLCDPSNY